MKKNQLYNLINTVSYKNIGDDVDYCILVRDNTIFLIFQGSRTKRDWINNLKFPTKIYNRQQSCLRVARGWGDSYKSCNDEIMNELIETSKATPDYPVFIIGHSLGGALSLLAAEDFNFRTKQYPIVVTFGAPKALYGKKSKEYLRTCCLSIEQYAHADDFVTKLPPFPGYTHVNKIKIGKHTPLKSFDIQNHLSYGNEDLYIKISS